jgi:hypothetical protein
LFAFVPVVPSNVAVWAKRALLIGVAVGVQWLVPGSYTSALDR